MTYTFTFHVVHANTEGMSTRDKWFRRTLTWQVEAESEEDAYTRLAQRIEVEYPEAQNYKASNVVCVSSKESKEDEPIMAEQTIASRDWHRRAIVRFKENVTCHSFAGEHTYRAGQEVEMVQWGRAGRPVERDAWWSDYDIDLAFIIDHRDVEVVRVIEEVTPTEQESEASHG